jgi:hypothetical protein
LVLIKNKKMERYKINLLYWLAKQFGYSVKLIKFNGVKTQKTKEKNTSISLREKTKKYFHSKLKKREKEIVIDKPITLTLEDKLKQCCKR